MGAKENRSYSRVSTRLRAHARYVSSTQSPPLFRSSPQTSSHPTETTLRESGIPEGLRSYLEMINSKLDMLLSVTNQSRLESDYPLKLEVVELSGAGLRCIKPESSISIGQGLEIVLLLSSMPLHMAATTGMVKRIESLEDAEHLIIEFTQMRESDREAIVQFVFREQREQIRTQRYED